jgi:predicted RNase H-like HicB family nuclease
MAHSHGPVRPLPIVYIRVVSVVNVVKFTIEIEQEQDQRWIAEVLELPGAMTYGSSPHDAQAKVQALALRVVADQLEHGEAGPEFLNITFDAA